MCLYLNNYSYFAARINKKKLLLFYKAQNIKCDKISFYIKKKKNKDTETNTVS